MADIPLKQRQIRLNAPNAGTTAGKINPQVLNSNKDNSLSQKGREFFTEALSVAEVFKNIKNQNDIARATNDLAVYKKKISDLMNSTETDPETGEVIGFLNHKGENAFKNIEAYQQKLSNLTSEYQKQIYSYNPQIRQKFDIESNQYHQSYMEKINSHALNETEQFQQNAAAAYFKDKEDNAIISSIQDYDNNYKDIYNQVALINPGQDEQFYKIKTEETMSKIVDRNTRRINELHANEPAYISYKYGLNFLRNLNKSGRITESQYKELLNKQQIRRFDAMTYEYNAITTDDFIKKLKEADGMDNLEKKKYLQTFLQKKNSISKTGANEDEDVWLQQTVYGPTSEGGMLGVKIPPEEMSGVAQQILTLLPYVTVKRKEDGTLIQYLNEEAMPGDFKKLIEENRELNNAYRFLIANINGTEDIPPLPILTPETREKVSSRLKAISNIKDFSYFQRHEKVQSMKNAVVDYINQYNNNQPVDNAEALYHAQQFVDYAISNVPDEVDSATKLWLQARNLVNQAKWKTAQGSSLPIVDHVQRAASAVSRWWSSPGMFDSENKAAREVNAETADYFAKGFWQDFSPNAFGTNRDINAGFYEAVYNMARTQMGGSGIKVLYNIKTPSGAEKLVSQELPIIPFSVTDALEIVNSAEYEFIKIKEEEDKSYGQKYYRMNYGDLSDADKILQRALLTKEFLKRKQISLNDNSLKGLNVLLSEELRKDKSEQGKNSDFVYILADNDENEAIKVARGSGFTSVNYNGKEYKTSLELKNNGAWFEDNIPKKFRPEQMSLFGKGVLKDNVSGITAIKVDAIDTKGKNKSIYVQVPEGETVFSFAEMINNIKNSKIKTDNPTMKPFSGMKITGADIYNDKLFIFGFFPSVDTKSINSKKKFGEN